MEAEQYNYDTFSKKRYSYTSFRERLRVGSRASEFEGRLLGSGTFRSVEHRGKNNVLLAFASITCPPSIESINNTPNSLEKLYQAYSGKGFQFYLVYVREAHPGESIPHHKSYEEKKANAELLRTEENVRIPIIVDTIDGAIHTAFGLLPNMIYVISKQGIIVYKSDWVNTEELRPFFDNLIEWERARHENRRHKVAFSERLHYVSEDDLELRKRVYFRAGQKAIEDYGGAMGQAPF